MMQDVECLPAQNCGKPRNVVVWADGGFCLNPGLSSTGPHTFLPLPGPSILDHLQSFNRHGSNFLLSSGCPEIHNCPTCNGDRVGFFSTKHEIGKSKNHPFLATNKLKAWSGGETLHTLLYVIALWQGRGLALLSLSPPAPHLFPTVLAFGIPYLLLTLSYKSASAAAFYHVSPSFAPFHISTLLLYPSRWQDACQKQFLKEISSSPCACQAHAPSFISPWSPSPAGFPYSSKQILPGPLARAVLILGIN